MTILFTKGRELLEQDMKKETPKEQPKQAQTKSGKVTMFSKKK